MWSAKGDGSGGGDTSPISMHDSPGNRTRGLSQKGMRGLVLPGRRELGLRVRKKSQAHHESLDALAVAHPLLYVGAGNVPSVLSQGTREAYRSRVGKPALRSSNPVRHRTSRFQTAIPRCNPPCSRAPPTNCSTVHGAPSAGACRRLQQTRPKDPLSA